MKMTNEKCEYCGRRGASSWCSACKMSVYCSKSCQKNHWKHHKPTCRFRNDVRAVAMTPLVSAPDRGLPPGRTTVDPAWLVSLQVYQHFGRQRANDYLVYESSVKLLLKNPIEIFGWSRFHIRTICREEEFKLLDSSNSSVMLSPNDRRYPCYVVLPDDSDYEDDDDDDEDSDELVDLGRYDHHDGRKIGTGTDEFTYRHPGTIPDGDERVTHLGLVDPENYAPTTTKASREIRVVTFVSQSIYGRILTSYNNQFAIRVDNSRRCLDYDCYEFKPESCGRHRSEDPNHLPNPAQIHQFEKTISCSVPTRIRAPPDPQEVRTVCHVKALSGEFFKSRCYRFRVSLDHVSGIRLVKEYDQCDSAQRKVNKDIAAVLAGGLQPGNHDDPAAMTDDEEKEELDNIASALIMEVSQPPLPNAFCVRTVADADNSFRVIGDWTPERSASRATRHIIYASFGELRELAAHLCVIDMRIAEMFRNGGGSLRGKSLLFDHAPSPTARGIEFPPILDEDRPKDGSFDGNLSNLVDCVKDRLIAMAEAGNHLGAAYIAKSLGLAQDL